MNEFNIDIDQDKNADIGPKSPCRSASSIYNLNFILMATRIRYVII